MTFLKNIFILNIFIILCIVHPLTAQDIPDRPEQYTPVYDAVKLLNKNEYALLSQKLIKYEDSTSTQIQIVIIDSLRGQNLELYAYNWATAWGIGQKGANNGLLLFIVFADRKIRLEVGYGLEDKISDAVSADILNNYLGPAFREKEYYKGINAALNEILKHLSGYYSNHDRYSPYYDHDLDRKWYQLRGEEWINVIIIFLIICAYNVLVYILYTDKKAKGNKKILKPVLFWFVSGNAILLLYAIYFGISLDPEPANLTIHFLIGFVLAILMSNHDNLVIKDRKKFLIRLAMFIAIWIASTVAAKFMIDDKIHDIWSFLIFVIYGFLIAIGVCLVLLFLYAMSLPSVSSGGSGGRSGTYKSSGSSSYKSSGSSSYKSSSYSGSSGSSYGGGSFGGGGASGSW